MFKKLNQCCGAGDGGAEIIWGPGAGAENKLNKHFLQSCGGC